MVAVRAARPCGARRAACRLAHGKVIASLGTVHRLRGGVVAHLRCPTPSIVIEPQDPGRPEASALIEQLDAYLTSLYPDASNHLMPLEALRQPNVIFLVANVDDQFMGCGAFVNHAGAYAEIKRIFVLPEARGLGLGRMLLDALEEQAKAVGLGVARLETGVAQPEALRLFERAGYRRRDAFGDYAPDPLSVFMEKFLV